MGKKSKDKKKGKGLEKTAIKTDKNLTNKQKKELAAIGEDDIENIVAEIVKEEQKKQKVVEAIVEPPSRRINFSFVPHPDKEELILFGGEYFDGQKTYLYNDLFFYNILRKEWTVVKSPGGPPPRCGHQMVSISASKGQLWIFGGEFASPTQSQFYHFRDLWVYHTATKKWEKINAAGGPSARSGHRMVHLKKQLFVFGGFHDNLKDYKYFNDVHCFNLETYKWTKIETCGNPPAPRSGCVMLALNEGRIVIYGGYSKEKIKKEVDKGNVYNDMYLLVPDKHDTTGTKYKWQIVKQRGVHFSPRCGMPTAQASNNNAYVFGGVFDLEENEEDIAGTFFNDLHGLDLEKLSWYQIKLTGKRDITKKKKEHIKEDNDIKEKNMEVEKNQIISDDGIFTVTVGPAPVSGSSQIVTTRKDAIAVFHPAPRMNCGLAIKHSVLYLYGGMVEEGSKQFTMCDFYSLDLKKQDEWQTILSDDITRQTWLGSDSDSSSEDEESDENIEEESETDDEESMDTD